MNHPLSKYGLALVLKAYNLKETEIDCITHEMLIGQLMEGLRHFRLYTNDDPEISNNLTYQHYGIEELEKSPELIQSSGLSGKGKYLAQNILSDEKSAKQVYNAVSRLINLLKTGTKLDKSEKITMSISPVSGKINNGKSSQSSPSSKLLEVCCFAIGNTHSLKPSFSFNSLNYGLIPDLPVGQLITFINFFEKMYENFKGKLYESKSKDGKFKRPAIIRGNYPDAPYHPIFGPVGLIASIGKWAREADIPHGIEVLDLLMGKENNGFYQSVPIYLFGYGKAEVLRYNHYIVELAKDNKLYKIVSDLEKSTLVGEERKQYDNPKYQQFYLFSTRFLQLFNCPAFKDFLSFRAIYEPEVIHILNIYFINVELKVIDMSISKEIVASARELGKWLNYAAYKAAEQSEDKNAGKDAINKAKAKFLVELESAAFSAKTGDEMISHIVTRAGRLSHTDVPPEAQVFMDASCSEEITKQQAQHLITAYSRLRNKYEKQENTEFVNHENHSLELE